MSPKWNSVKWSIFITYLHYTLHYTYTLHLITSYYIFILQLTQRFILINAQFADAIVTTISLKVTCWGKVVDNIVKFQYVKCVT